MHATYEYGGALADALVRFKWLGRDDLASPLAALLGPLLSRLAVRYDAVVPVPLHPTRLRGRGFNQSVLLARGALRWVPRGARPVLQLGLLQRTRPDPPARDVDVAGRFARVRDAFALRPGVCVRGLRLLILDDVITSGATALACATVLTAGGAARVDALALARVT